MAVSMAGWLDGWLDQVPSESRRMNAVLQKESRSLMASSLICAPLVCVCGHCAVITGHGVDYGRAPYPLIALVVVMAMAVMVMAMVVVVVVVMAMVVVVMAMVVMVIAKV